MKTNTQPNWREHLPLILIIIGIAALLALLIWRLEWVEEEVDLGPTMEAKRNPFLASQRLLEQRDIQHHTQQGFSVIEQMQWQGERVDTEDTLLLVNAYHNLHEQQVERLWRWVENGGRLIVSLENPHIGSGEHLRDPLLNRMGLTLHANYYNEFADTEQDSACAEEAEDIEAAEANRCAEPVETALPATSEEEEDGASKGPRDSCLWLQETVSAQLQEHEPELLIGVSGDSYLTTESIDTQILAGDEEAAFLIRQPLGSGEIYAITSAIAWKNSNIGCNDNAYLFSRLTADSDKVWYAINQQVPSFWRHLWQLSPIGSSALLLALAFWLWMHAARFGPILQSQQNGRRKFIDHIHAAAQFTLRHRGNAALVNLLRNDIVHIAQLRQPGFPGFTRSDKVRTLHSMSGLSTADIDIALYQPTPLSESQFLDVVKRLQNLRNRL